MATICISATMAVLAGCQNLLGIDDTAVAETELDLVALEFSAFTELSPSFSASTVDYAASLSPLVRCISVTATPRQGDVEMTLNGDPIDAGVPSGVLSLTTDQTELRISISQDSATKTYSVLLTRNSSIAHRAYLKPTNTNAGDLFGSSIGADNNVLIVGANAEDSSDEGVNGEQQSNAASDSGAGYIFRRFGQEWRQEAYVKASNTDPTDRFGSAVAIGDQLFAIGAFGESSSSSGINQAENDNSSPSSGAVYVFTKSETWWVQDAYIKPSNTNDSDAFGQTIAISGNMLVVATSGEDSGATGIDGNQNMDTQTNSGAAYIFRRDGLVWQQEAYIKASNTQNGDAFGQSVSLNGDFLAVGAHLEDSCNQDQANNDCSAAGAVYVFRRTGGVWSQDAFLKADNADDGDRFGVSVSLVGDTLVIGADSESSSAVGAPDDNSTQESGAVYVFRRSGGTWVQEARLKANNADEFDRFGSRLSFDGEFLAVGAEEEDSDATDINGDQANNGASDAGAVYFLQ